MKSFMFWSRKARAIPFGLVIVTATTALLGMTTGSQGRPLDATTLDRSVGQLSGRCCRPGRRFGCDADNLGQTNCIKIDVNHLPHCWRIPRAIMLCTSAYCRPAGTESNCHMHYIQVGQNTCHATGHVTTIGCEPNQWKCDIKLVRYDAPGAPQTVVTECMEGSTICHLPYAFCD